jgi:hypothetical protein
MSAVHEALSNLHVLLQYLDSDVEPSTLSFTNAHPHWAWFICRKDRSFEATGEGTATIETQQC